MISWLARYPFKQRSEAKVQVNTRQHLDSKVSVFTPVDELYLGPSAIDSLRGYVLENGCFDSDGKFSIDVGDLKTFYADCPTVKKVLGPLREYPWSSVNLQYVARCGNISAKLFVPNDLVPPKTTFVVTGCCDAVANRHRGRVCNDAVATEIVEVATAPFPHAKTPRWAGEQLVSWSCSFGCARPILPNC